LSHAWQLLAAKQNTEAAEVLGRLVDRLEEAQAALPTNMKSSSATIKKAQNNIAAGKIDLANGQLSDLVKQIATSTALDQMKEIRANLQEAWLAAQRKQPAVVKAILEDTGQYTARLGELLPAPKVSEGNSR